MSDVAEDSTFATDWLYDVLDELPGGQVDLEYVGETQSNGGRDGVALELLPGSARSWKAVFAYGTLATRAPSGVFVLPDQRLLVVARGAGYIVDPTRDRQTASARPNPIMQVVVAESARLVLVADRWSVTAYGDQGEMWSTGRIAMDGVSVGEVSERVAACSAYVSSDEERPFTIELATGLCMGVVPIRGG